MITLRSPSLRGVLVGAVLAACGGSAPRQATVVEAAPTLARAAPMLPQPSIEPLPEGVTADTRACEPTTEACNGRDDDCDGRIDEGCGYDSGPVQVTLAWDTGADLDLYVTEPTEFLISYLDTTSPGGGSLDRDARGACIPGGQSVENVRWTGDPPRGRYRIEIQYWGECGGAGPTPAQLSVSVGGRVIGTYDLVLQPGQRRTALVFSL
jgi:tRNA (guanosine-2'-O-)-methyltransferase